jgi:HEAT repeat protein
MKSLIHIAIAFGVLMPSARGQDVPEMEELLAKLNENQIQDDVIVRLGKYHDHRVIAALRAAFDAHEEKQTRQYIAFSLIGLGDKDDKYFRFIEAFAQEAIESDAPDMFTYGRDGVALRPVQWSPEFYAWSAQHGIPIELAVKQAVQTYPRDVMIFAGVSDPRAAELIRRGLQSHNPLVVGACAYVLGINKDTPSIPLILKLINTSRQSVAEALTMRITLFNGDQVERLILDGLANPKLKEFYRSQIEAKHKNPPSSPQ